MMSTSRIVIDGLAFHYRIDGEENAPWLVFSNSLMTDLTIWDAQVDILRDRFRILRYDQRGHGGTEVPDATPDFRRLALDVVALLDALAIDRCTFVGLSMGVPTALALWREAPTRVERLVLSDGQAKTAPTGHAMWQERIDFVRANGMPAFADTVVPRWFSPDFVADGRAEPVRKGIARTPVQGFCALAGSLQAFDLAEVLPTITVPTLLVVGENDGPAPVVMEQMHKVIPGSRYKVIPNAGHIPNWERPEAFNRALLDFFDLP